MQRHRSGCRRWNRQRRRWNHKDPCGGRLPLCFLHSTRWTHRNRFCCVPNVSFLTILLTPGLFCHSPVDRLLLMEKHYERILVHPVAVWHDQQTLEGSGAPAHHDTSEPQGGSRVWVCLQLTRLQCKETDPVHCVYADQRDVFLSLMSLLLRWKCTEVVLGNDFTEHITDSCSCGCNYTYCKIGIKRFPLCGELSRIHFFLSLLKNYRTKSSPGKNGEFFNSLPVQASLRELHFRDLGKYLAFELIGKWI